jgi:hypothetical protein
VFDVLPAAEVLEAASVVQQDPMYGWVMNLFVGTLLFKLHAALAASSLLRAFTTLPGASAAVAAVHHRYCKLRAHRVSLLENSQ